MMTKKKFQIGVLGGSFDPIHMGHLGLAQGAFDNFGLDQILFIPAFQSPNKTNAPFVSPMHRKEMLRLALKDNIAFNIADVELIREEPSYTIDTLTHLEKKLLNSELFLILGKDNLLSFDSWKESRKIMKRFNILVALRPNLMPFSPASKVLSFFNKQSPYRLGNIENKMHKFFHKETEKKLVIFNIQPRNISSSSVRGKLAQGKSVKNLLPPEVEAYIIRNQIYQTKFPLNSS